MAVSLSNIDRRQCPGCGEDVTSELWLIVHRHERPKLWERASSLRILTCPNGHSGPVRAPLLLYDPAGPNVIYSPGDMRDGDYVKAEFAHLMDTLFTSLPPDQRTPLAMMEWAAAADLKSLLSQPLLNLGDLAPGTPASEEALRICSDIRSGHASLEELRSWSAVDTLHPAMRAGTRFELASYLGRAGLTRSDLIENAIAEWRQVIRLYPKTTATRRWAIAQMELALCYARRREANPAANRREALRLLDAALEVLTEDAFAEDFALASQRKANLLLDMGNDLDLVDESLRCFQAALSVYTKESYRDDRMLLMSNMATAYLERAYKSGLNDLRKGVALLEEVVGDRRRARDSMSVAYPLMNLGLALSRLPRSEAPDEYARAHACLRAAHELFEASDLTHMQVNAAYNLGVTLARSTDPAIAKEACDRLEECLAVFLREDRNDKITEIISLLSQAYMTQLRVADGDSGNAICRRALSVLHAHVENDSAMQALNNIGNWLLKNAVARADNLELAGRAFERALGFLNASEYAELRAGALTNFATVLLHRQEGSMELNRVRARDSLDEALSLFRSLPVTAEREGRIGTVLMNRMACDIEIEGGLPLPPYGRLHSN